MNCSFSVGGGQGHREEGRGQAWEGVQEVQLCRKVWQLQEGTNGEVLRPSSWILQFIVWPQGSLTFLEPLTAQLLPPAVKATTTFRTISESFTFKAFP